MYIVCIPYNDYRSALSNESVISDRQIVVMDTEDFSAEKTTVRELYESGICANNFDVDKIKGTVTSYRRACITFLAKQTTRKSFVQFRYNAEESKFRVKIGSQNLHYYARHTASDKDDKIYVNGVGTELRGKYVDRLAYMFKYRNCIVLRFIGGMFGNGEKLPWATILITSNGKIEFWDSDYNIVSNRSLAVEVDMLSGV